MKRVSKDLSTRIAGFTLVEIMIVVLIIGILLAIAIPNFVTARNSSRAKSCVSNLRKIDSAKQQYIMDGRLSSATTPTSANLAPTYLKSFPTCPASGSYTIGDGNTNPSCSFSDTQYPHSLT